MLPSRTHKKIKWGAKVCLGYLKQGSSYRRCSMTKGFPKNFTEFTGKHLCQSLFFNKVAGLVSTTLLKKRNWHKCFPVNCMKYWRISFYRISPGDYFCKYLHRTFFVKIINNQKLLIIFALKLYHRYFTRS